MHAQATPASGPTCIAHGFGLKVYVERGHLIVDDGICDERQTRRYNRATGKLQRLVVIGQSGYVTLDALRWLRDVGATFVQIDNDGRLVTVSAKPSTDRPAVRRAQVVAAKRPAGIKFARWALGEKLRGQSAVLSQLPQAGAAASTVAVMLRELEAATTLDAILAAEAQAAAAYWDAWSTLPVRFSPTARIADHWRVFGQRHSTLTASPRQAVNPANAVLNYLYSLVEAETTVASHVVGLDPGLGVFHRDRQGRSSLTLDLMEPIRPIADAYVLALLTKRVLTAREFIETRRGNCRILPVLASQLAQTIPAWASHAAPVVEAGARILTTAGDKSIKHPTPLTNTNRRATRNSRRAPAVHAPSIELPSTCRDCGEPLLSRRQRYCAACRDARFRATAPSGRAAASAVLQQLRQDGQDPAHGGQAGQARGSKNAAHQAAMRAWQGDQPDPETFRTDVVPGLHDVRISELVAVTGLSEHYCSLIRLGKRVPHARHWMALQQLAFGVPRHP